MPLSTLCFPIRKDKVLLGIKQKKIGAGLWNGYGGKQDGNENIKQTAVRELLEECGLAAKVDDLRLIAEINFLQLVGETRKELFVCFIYVVDKWIGEPKDTLEMKDHTWFPITQLPLSKMLAGDQRWLPTVLQSNQIIRGTMVYSDDLTRVESFEYTVS